MGIVARHTYCHVEKGLLREREGLLFCAPLEERRKASVHRRRDPDVRCSHTRRHVEEIIGRGRPLVHLLPTKPRETWPRRSPSADSDQPSVDDLAVGSAAKKEPPSTVAIAPGELALAIRLKGRTCKYLNNIVEQDHRAIHQRRSATHA